MGHPRLGWWLGVASWLHVIERLVSKTWYIWVFRRENASRLFTCLLWVQNGSMPNHHNLWSPRSWILHHTGSHVLTVNIWIEHTIVNLLKSDPFRNSEPWAQAVDEIAFLSVSASQWLLGELHVAATAWKPEELRSESDSVRPPTDTAARVVQVLPGPHASIEEASESEARKHSGGLATEVATGSGNHPKQSKTTNANCFQNILNQSIGDIDRNHTVWTRYDYRAMFLSDYLAFVGLFFFMTVSIHRSTICHIFCHTIVTMLFGFPIFQRPQPCSFPMGKPQVPLNGWDLLRWSPKLVKKLSQLSAPLEILELCYMSYIWWYWDIAGFSWFFSILIYYSYFKSYYPSVTCSPFHLANRRLICLWIPNLLKHHEPYLLGCLKLVTGYDPVGNHGKLLAIKFNFIKE